jgi:hypothetical protein
MALKASSLFNRLKNKLGLGIAKPSRPTPVPDETIASSSTSKPSPQPLQPTFQKPSEPTESNIKQAERVSASVRPQQFRANRKGSPSVKPEMPMRQRWRASAVRAAKRAQSLY